MQSHIEAWNPLHPVWEVVVELHTKLALDACGVSHPLLYFETKDEAVNFLYSRGLKDEARYVNEEIKV